MQTVSRPIISRPIISRPRRNRSTPMIRNLIRETQLSLNDIIAPVFVIEGKGQKIPIKSMPGIYRYSIDQLILHLKELIGLGIQGISLFPAIDEKLKTANALEAINPDGLNQRAVKEIKSHFPHLLVMTDVALDPYSSDGHDGLVDKSSGEILNDQTLEVLAQMAQLQAMAGSDLIGPSDMMDGRVAAIRSALDDIGKTGVGIISYTAKYASSFYGPFRDALDSAPKAGDKKTYQMDFANSNEALREAQLDQLEGADILMVKPGLSYLDIIWRLKDSTHLPVAAYNVSGEYAMVKAASEMGYLDQDAAMLEILTSFKRAGADMILTYFAHDYAKLLQV